MGQAAILEGGRVKFTKKVSLEQLFEGGKRVNIADTRRMSMVSSARVHKQEHSKEATWPEWSGVEEVQAPRSKTFALTWGEMGSFGWF